MAEITARQTVPAGDPATVSKSEKFRATTGNYLRVALIAQNAAVGVRPWHWKDGYWWPLRGDSVSGVGSATVTANPLVYNGKAEGVFHSCGISSDVVLVAESGIVGNVVKAFIDVASVESA